MFINQIFIPLPLRQDFDLDLLELGGEVTWQAPSSSRVKERGRRHVWFFSDGVRRYCFLVHESEQIGGLTCSISWDLSQFKPQGWDFMG